MNRVILVLLASIPVAVALGQQPGPEAPDPRRPIRASASEMRDTVDRWVDDREALQRRYPLEGSTERRRRMRKFHEEWLARVDALDYEAMSLEGRLDWQCLRLRLFHALALLAREEKREAEAAPLLPFATAIEELEEARRRMEPAPPEACATTLDRLAAEVEKTRKAVEAGAAERPPPEAIRASKTLAFRAGKSLEELRRTLESWYRFRAGYDPAFTWWTGAPWKKADGALEAYGKVLRERIVGVRDGEEEPIVGDPIGREAILEDLAREAIAYSPEELVAIAEREFAWCEAEMKKAAREMGLGEDWGAALERVKGKHVEPGKQDELVAELAREAIAFVESRSLVTVPDLAREIWRMEMLSPERQKESPFFLGGETIRVAFPTDGMAHEDKRMSLRGNNIHFARATVHHELIPGHHLQGFMNERWNPHRRAFSTPFWTEGWALYWEILLWDLGFPRSPEDRVGMLFWRMHRCARILFSLGFHLGTMSPQASIDLLVERVGHERANATAEVRRSFQGGYGPLYQVAYMIGGLQFRALRRDLVESGRMTDRAFHDAILRGGPMPVECVRARLAGSAFPRDWKPSWRFAGEGRAGGR
ncbi:MAG: DUF885 domain-containing protein [Planctomycetes bacterium]|nr:DUF885 domain-containing protein [Planctomycetota bacterium]